MLQGNSKGRFSVEADLVFTTVPALWKASQRQFGRIRGNLLKVDLAAAQRVDSAGLALLVAWTRWARRHHMKIRFLRPSPQLQALARANGLSRLLQMKDAARQTGH